MNCSSGLGPFEPQNLGQAHEQKPSIVHLSEEGKDDAVDVKEVNEKEDDGRFVEGHILQNLKINDDHFSIRTTHIDYGYDRHKRRLGRRKANNSDCLRSFPCSPTGFCSYTDQYRERDSSSLEDVDVLSNTVEHDRKEQVIEENVNGQGEKISINATSSLHDSQKKRQFDYVNSFSEVTGDFNPVILISAAVTASEGAHGRPKSPNGYSTNRINSGFSSALFNGNSQQSHEYNQISMSRQDAVNLYLSLLLFSSPVPDSARIKSEDFMTRNSIVSSDSEESGISFKQKKDKKTINDELDTDNIETDSQILGLRSDSHESCLRESDYRKLLQLAKGFDWMEVIDEDFKEIYIF